MTTRILVVDDSAVVRGLLAKMLDLESDLTVSGTAPNGTGALAWLSRHTADVVLLDVEMPIMGGIETLSEIKAKYPDLPVIMASTLTTAAAKITVQALCMGAAGCVAKPTAGSQTRSIDQMFGELLPLIRSLHPQDQPSTKPAERPSPSVLSTPTITRQVQRPDDHFDPEILVIGSSTGGPEALRRVLTRLPVDFPLPIGIVQHLPSGFSKLLADQLDRDTPFEAKEAAEADLFLPGRILIAPGDRHLSLVRLDGKLRAHLTDAPAEHYSRPSVNVLFRAVATTCGSRALGVMLTGMGADGREGSIDLHNRGARLIAQDEASSVVWGMPGAIVREGIVDQIVALDSIAETISAHIPVGSRS